MKTFNPIKYSLYLYCVIYNVHVVCSYCRLWKNVQYRYPRLFIIIYDSEIMSLYVGIQCFIYVNTKRQNSWE